MQFFVFSYRLHSLLLHRIFIVFNLNYLVWLVVTCRCPLLNACPPSFVLCWCLLCFFVFFLIFVIFYISLWHQFGLFVYIFSLSFFISTQSELCLVYMLLFEFHWNVFRIITLITWLVWGSVDSLTGVESVRKIQWSCLLSYVMISYIYMSWLLVDLSFVLKVKFLAFFMREWLYLQLKINLVFISR